tara:strand:- start:471 stop:947 length:477 start_codon:yes stop_codon:yes gene_type:complete
MNHKIEKIYSLLKEAEDIAMSEGYGNIFYNEQFIELFIADRLGETWNKETQGGDAFDSEGNPTEYKAINMRSKSAGSFQFHWLSEAKIEKLKQCKTMKFVIRDGVTIKEIYELPTSKLIGLIEEKSMDNTIHGHKSFSLQNIIDMGAEKIFSACNSIG